MTFKCQSLCHVGPTQNILLFYRSNCLNITHVILIFGTDVVGRIFYDIVGLN